LRLRALSVALCLLLGVGYVLPALHFAFVAHRVCAEHGELLHSSSGVELAGTHRSPEESVGSISISPGNAAAHEHEHCGTLALPGSVGAAFAARDSAGMLPVLRAALPPCQSRVAHVDVPLLLYAPKLAPPA
jgi:hypothetical protein